MAPITVAEFEKHRAMLDMDEDASLGSGSAEVAFINNESIHRSQKSSRASSQHSVTKQQPVARKLVIIYLRTYYS